MKSKPRILAICMIAFCTLSTAAQPSTGNADGQDVFAKIKTLTGEWVAPLGGEDKMVNIFEPFAGGTKILATEWENGRHITSTVFYLVGTELRADHFCDYLNEPRYALHFSPTNRSVIQFQFLSATNLSSHPLHFHSTTWHLVDDRHLVQDWYTQGTKTSGAPIHMEFTRTAVSLRSDGSPTVFVRK